MNIYPAGGKDALVENQIALDREFDVFVIKQLRALPQDYDTELKNFQSYYSEFISTIKGKLDFIFKRKDVILQPIIDTRPSPGTFPIRTSAIGPGFTPALDAAPVQLYINASYIDIVALGIIDLSRPAWAVRVRSSAIDGIEDVLNVSTRLSVSSAGSASVTIKNDLNKYCFQKNTLLVGKTIFEADDIIVIRLPDKNNVLRVCFTGFINKVTRNKAPNQNTINLDCEDVTKRLRYSRVAIRKALIDRDPEAQYIPLSAFVFPWVQGDGGGAEAVEKVVSNVGAFSFSTINSIPSISSSINQYNVLYKQKNFFSTQTQNLAGAINSGNVGIERGDAIDTEIANLRKKIEDDRSNNITQYIDTSGSTGMKVQGTQIFKNTKALVTAQASNFVKKPIMVIEGTAQPAYDVAFRNGFDLWISEWKEVQKLFQEFANIVNFEFFATEEGVVRFRPVNVSLQQLVNPANINAIADTDIYQENTYEDNTDIANVAVVTGNWKIRLGTNLDALGIFGYIKDNRLIKKYGEKMLNIQPVIGLITNASLNVWASSVLNRINRKAFSGGSLEVIGDSRYRVGNYIYLKSSNMLFYVDSIEHSIAPGSRYTCRMNLTYRRMPVLDLAGLIAGSVVTGAGVFVVASNDENRNVMQRKLDRDILKNEIFTVLSAGQLNLAYNSILSTMKVNGYSPDEIAHIYNPQKLFTKEALSPSLSPFYYGGYIWEYGVDIDFADALAIEKAYIAGQVAADNKNASTKATKITGMPTNTNFDTTQTLAH